MTLSARRLRLAALAAGLLLAPSAVSGPRPPLPAAPARAPSSPGETVEEYRLKAAFLYNFANYTVWPEEAFASDEAPLVFAVLGDDPFGEHLADTLEGKRLHGREIELVHFEELEDLGHCHLLFVSRSERTRVEEIHEALEGRPVFTVSDLDRYAHDGGVARLGIEEQRPVMEINTDAARRAGLSISSQLLKLARVIEEQRASGGDAETADGSGSARERVPAPPISSGRARVEDDA